MAEPTPPPAVISYDDFAKLDLRVATVLRCEPHPNADKLVLLQVDLGSEQRQLVAGIRGHYESAALVGRQIIIVANLAPRMMRGYESQGMLLAATGADGSVILLTTERPIAAGAHVS
jgi:methionyl-tRNA synthetase